MSQSLAVVIPVYNGAATLPALIERLVPVVRSSGAPYEIILVNDGSRDSSWATIQSSRRGIRRFRAST